MAFFLKRLNHKEKIKDPKPSCFFNRMHHGDWYFALNLVQFIPLQELLDWKKRPYPWDTKWGFAVFYFSQRCVLSFLMHSFLLFLLKTYVDDSNKTSLNRIPKTYRYAYCFITFLTRRVWMLYVTQIQMRNTAIQLEYLYNQ